MIEPMPGQVIIEPTWRRDELKSSIPNFQFKKPDFEGTPNSGKVHALPADVTDVSVGDIVIFNTEPTPPGFEIDGLKLMAVPYSQIAAVVKEQA